MVYDQPQTIERRVEIAREFIETMDYQMEVVVDPIDNSAEQAFAAWPERLYILDRHGKVAYKGGMGPHDFRIDEVKSWLRERFN